MAEELTPMELETVAALLRHKRRADAAKDLGIKVRGLSRRCIAHPAIVREVLRLRRAELDKVTAERTGPSLKDEAVRLLREVTESDKATPETKLRAAEMLLGVGAKAQPKTVIRHGRPVTTKAKTSDRLTALEVGMEARRLRSLSKADLLARADVLAQVTGDKELTELVAKAKAKAASAPEVKVDLSQQDAEGKS